MCLSNALTTDFPRNWVIPKRGQAVMIFIKTIDFKLLRRAFDLMLARWRSQPIKSLRRGRLPIRERVYSINLKSYFRFTKS